MPNPQKPRYDSLQRVLTRMRSSKIVSEDTIQRYAEEHGLCPDHLLYLPCPKC